MVEECYSTSSLTGKPVNRFLIGRPAIQNERSGSYAHNLPRPVCSPGRVCMQYESRLQLQEMLKHI